MLLMTTTPRASTIYNDYCPYLPPAVSGPRPRILYPVFRLPSPVSFSLSCIRSSSGTYCASSPDGSCQQRRVPRRQPSKPKQKNQASPVCSTYVPHHPPVLRLACTPSKFIIATDGSTGKYVGRYESTRRTHQRRYTPISVYPDREENLSTNQPPTYRTSNTPPLVTSVVVARGRLLPYPSPVLGIHETPNPPAAARCLVPNACLLASDATAASMFCQHVGPPDPLLNRSAALVHP
ncbi:hypothetical protein IWZ00DRAFT_127772 [Phyllosticta capitalensis]